ncbi:MAG TPA: hypothetical protein VGD24_10325, partial [Gallionella sp.]
MKQFSTELPSGLEELRYQGLVRFAALLESQTRSRLFARNIGDLVHSINAEIGASLEDCIRQLEQTSLSVGEISGLVEQL